MLAPDYLACHQGGASALQPSAPHPAALHPLTDTQCEVLQRLCPAHLTHAFTILPAVQHPTPNPGPICVITRLKLPCVRLSTIIHHTTGPVVQLPVILITKGHVSSPSSPRVLVQGLEMCRPRNIAIFILALVHSRTVHQEWGVVMQSRTPLTQVQEYMLLTSFGDA